MELTFLDAEERDWEKAMAKMDAFGAKIRRLVHL